MLQNGADAVGVIGNGRIALGLEFNAAELGLLPSATSCALRCRALSSLRS
jgi:hypothetical protein